MLVTGPSVNRTLDPIANATARHSDPIACRTGDDCAFLVEPHASLPPRFGLWRE